MKFFVNMSELEKYFEPFRKNTIGYDFKYYSPYGQVPLVYADWIASGRLYRPIEQKIIECFGSFVANTHTESSTTGLVMTEAYHQARRIIKQHVNASEDDVLIATGFGMTAALVKLQRILGLKLCGELERRKCLKKLGRPVVFITHMEHHSNHTSWYETIADVVIIRHTNDLLVDLNDLEAQLKRYNDRPLKIGSFTACSNVTGIVTPYYDMARLMHRHGGVCFVDFAASAPYVDIDMHPADDDARLDGIFFSPHKFLGGPGSSGILIFNKLLYQQKPPDQPGGGTVEWTTPWGEYQYIDDIEVREDGGTPGFLQCIKTALAIKLKEQMNTKKMFDREREILPLLWNELENIPKLHILASNVTNRLPIISFYIDDMHYNLITKLLSDRYGIQVRGGCACAGTYGHYLLQVSYDKSKEIISLISSGDLSKKLGWVRISLHPTTTTDQVLYIAHAIREISEKYHNWKNDYDYNKKTNEFIHKQFRYESCYPINQWFQFQ